MKGRFIVLGSWFLVVCPCESDGIEGIAPSMLEWWSGGMLECWSGTNGTEAGDRNSPADTPALGNRVALRKVRSQTESGNEGEGG